MNGCMSQPEIVLPLLPGVEREARQWLRIVWSAPLCPGVAAAAPKETAVSADALKRLPAASRRGEIDQHGHRPRGTGRREGQVDTGAPLVLTGYPE